MLFLAAKFIHPADGGVQCEKEKTPNLQKEVCLVFEVFNLTESEISVEIAICLQLAVVG